MLRFCDSRVCSVRAPQRETYGNRERFSPGTCCRTGVASGRSEGASAARYKVRPESCLTASPDPKRLHPATANAIKVIKAAVIFFTQLHHWGVNGSPQVRARVLAVNSQRWQ